MAQKRKKIICFGMAVTDVYSGPFRRDLMDRRFSPFSDLYVTVGGDALNCSSNFAKMGCDTRIIACVGRDALGRSVRRIVEESGVDTTYLLQPEGAHTSMTHLFHGPEKLPYYVLMLGANKEISYEMVTDDMLEGYDHLYYASINALEKMEGHGVAMLLKQAKRLGLSTSMDIKGTGGKFEYLEEALDYCDVFIPNHDEITDVTGLTDLQDIKRFFSRYPLKVLGVKRGAEGSFLTDFKQDLHLGTLFTGTPVD
ncbi:MAG: carbohydrate kinase family protein, partial [Christensenellales bacterium]